MKKIKNIALASVFAVGALVSMVSLNTSANAAEYPVSGCRYTGVEGDYCNATVTGVGEDGEVVFEFGISITGCVPNSVVSGCAVN